MADNNSDQNGNTQQTPEEIAAATAKAEEVAAAAKKKAEEDAEAARKAALSTVNKADSEMINKMVSDRLAEALTDIKGKLDGAYKQRDDSLAKIAAFEAKEREATLKRLAEEGKHKEAFEMQLAEERSKNEALQKRNTELSRDVSVREALRGFTFRNDKASDMAFKEITANLIQDAQGQWVHRTGISVRDYCDAFSKDEEQSFLFKAKANSGSGSSGTGNGAPPVDKPTSIFKMSQAEVLKLAAEGKLKNQRGQ
jgi:hypothetical protein